MVMPGGHQYFSVPRGLENWGSFLLPSSDLSMLAFGCLSHPLSVVTSALPQTAADKAVALAQLHVADLLEGEAIRSHLGQCWSDSLGWGIQTFFHLASSPAVTRDCSESHTAGSVQSPINGAAGSTLQNTGVRIHPRKELCFPESGLLQHPGSTNTAWRLRVTGHIAGRCWQDHWSFCLEDICSTPGYRSSWGNCQVKPPWWKRSIITPVTNSLSERCCTLNPSLKKTKTSHLDSQMVAAGFDHLQNFKKYTSGLEKVKLVAK